MAKQATDYWGVSFCFLLLALMIGLAVWGGTIEARKHRPWYMTPAWLEARKEVKAICKQRPYESGCFRREMDSRGFFSLARMESDSIAKHNRAVDAFYAARPGLREQELRDKAERHEAAVARCEAVQYKDSSCMLVPSRKALSRSQN